MRYRKGKLLGRGFFESFRIFLRVNPKPKALILNCVANFCQLCEQWTVQTVQFYPFHMQDREWCGEIAVVIGKVRVALWFEVRS